MLTKRVILLTAAAVAGGGTGAPPADEPAAQQQQQQQPPPRAKSPMQARYENLASKLGIKSDASDAEFLTAVEKLMATKEGQAKDEEVITQKMSKGLNRAQAIAVIQRNREYAKLPVTQERAARKPDDEPGDRSKRLVEFQKQSPAAAKAAPAK